MRKNTLGAICTFFFFSFIMLFVCMVTAQEVDYPCSNYIVKGKFDKAEEKLLKALQKGSDLDAKLYYALFELYSNKDYALFEPDKAYNYLKQSEEAFYAARDKDSVKLVKHGYSPSMYYQACTRVADYALDIADKASTIAAYEHFLKIYRSASEEQKSQAIDKRNALAFKEVLSQNTIMAYEAFMQKYPSAKEFEQATKKRDKLAFDETLGKGTLESYKTYIEKYPYAIEAKQAWDSVFSLAYVDARKKNTEKAYREYARIYPNSSFVAQALANAENIKYLRETDRTDWRSFRRYISNNPSQTSQCADAMLQIFRIAKATHNIDALNYLVKAENEILRDSALLILHGIYTEDGNISTIMSFYNEYTMPLTNKTLTSLKEKDMALKNIVEWGSTDEIIKAAAPYTLAYFALQREINDDLVAKRWTQALATVRKYEQYFGNDNAYRNLLNVLEAPLDKSIKINNFGPSINTKDGDEYSPVISADGKTLLFCGKNRTDNIGGEDIYISTKRGGVWGKAKLFSDVNTWGNEAPEALSADGTRLIMFKNGNQCITNKTGSGWEYPEKMPSNINIDTWQADAMISSDGRAILFCSAHKTSHELDKPANVYEASNIYVSLLDENGEWGEPIDLGPTINTPFCDRSPILHPDMKTLYFCSKGHGALGDLDVFMSTRLYDTSWIDWSEPVSLGKEINTVGQECWYKISTDGKTAYFSKNTGDNQDVYWINLPEKMRPNPVATISGTLTDTKGVPVETEIKWEDVDKYEVIGQSRTDPEDGSFFIILPMGRNYGYYIEDDNYFPLSSSLNLKGRKENIVIVGNNLNVASVEQMIAEEIAMPMNNLFFNSGDSTLLPQSYSELQRVARLIQKINRKVEIGGHTDYIGDDDMNDRLSFARANAAKKYLISLGCDESKITTVGYGKSKPVANNRTSEGRRKNRRVEIKFIK